MGRLFVDGFESGSFGLWAGSYSNAAVISTTVPTGMSGTYTMLCTSYHGYYLSFASSQDEIYLAFKYRPTDMSNSRDILRFRDTAGTVIASLRRNQTSQYVEARLGAHTGTLLATGTIPLAVNTTYLIEVRYKPLNSGGVITTKIDKTQDINYSGDTTNGLENIQTVNFGYDNGSESAYCYFDDVIIDDADWIGNTKIAGIAPTGAGATTGWTASAGNNWDCVEEKPPSDTDYVYTNTENAVDTYVLENLPANVGAIRAVAVQTRNWREGDGTVSKLQHVVRPASTDRAGATVNGGADIPISAQSFQTIWELNPEDAAAWEVADVNGMEAGPKAVTA